MRGCGRITGVVAAVALVAACSGQDERGAPAGTTVPGTALPGTALPGTVTPGNTVQAEEALPQVGAIADAVAAVERQLGGPQQYFEINATALRVNLFVSLNNATLAQAFSFLGGRLTSQTPAAASGNTFAASALTFDPQRLLAKVRTDLPGSVITAVEIVGGPQGAVRYTAIVSSREGSGLLVVLDPAGNVLSVDNP